MPPPPPYKIKGFRHFKLKNLFKKKAFTLAETLITLTIIGVVAALTVPTLIAKYQNQQFVTGLKKAYSNISNAIKMMPVVKGCATDDYECMGLSNLESSNSFATVNQAGPCGSEYAEPDKRKSIFSDTLKVQDYCLTCIPWQHQEKIAKNNSFATYGFSILEDGMIISAGCFSDHTEFGVDINGLKGPNKIGRDIFFFTLTTSNLWDSYGNIAEKAGNFRPFNSYGFGSPESYCTTEVVNADQEAALNCAERVLKEGAMNY